MRVIIAGSRHMPTDKAHLIDAAIHLSGFDVTEVVCGMARGADTLGRLWAEQRGIPVDKYPAQWSEYGRAAGPIRNRTMAEVADALIVFIWDGSRGSQNMLDQMESRKKPTFIVRNGILPTAT